MCSPWLLETMIYPLYFVMHALFMIVISSVKVDCVMLAQECHGANVGCALLPEFCFTRYWRKNSLVLLLVITSGLLFMKSISSDLCGIVWLLTVIMCNCMITILMWNCMVVYTHIMVVYNHVITLPAQIERPSVHTTGLFPFAVFQRFVVVF